MQSLPIAAKTAAFLKQAYAKEMQAVVTYNQFAAIQSARGYPKIAAKFIEEAAEESGHARRIAERLVVCGEKPPGNTSCDVPDAEKITEQLTHCLGLEEGAVNTYRNAIEAADNVSDYGTYQLAATLLQDSEEHYVWLAQQLSLIEAIGLPDYLTMWA